jgi:tRNA A58 N-methylase Trm61
MSRIYKITLGHNMISNECTYVASDSIESITDYSADHISCDVLQEIEFNNEIIQKLYNKLKPNGIITFIIPNVSKIAKDYISSNISSDAFVSQMHKIKKIISLDDIYASIPPSVSIQQLTNKENNITITLVRTGI